MKIQYLKNIVAITFALLIMASSITLSFDAHYCQSKLKSVSLFGQAKSCHALAEKQNSTCGIHETSCNKCGKINLQKKDCCSNKTLLLSDGDNATVEPQINEFQQVNANFLVAFSNAFISIDYKNTEKIGFDYYRPPPLTSVDKQVLFQTFLI